ncbi:MAG: MBL fold metallo-hydrolase [Smithellaceae bacterium]|nr:MBL fold metallo-hydrolase [Smithellaceae bacterium]
MYDFEKGSVRFIRGGRYPFCHSVLIDDGIRSVIDASSVKEKLLTFKKEKSVEYLINTHAHEDHLVFNFLFEGSKFCAHREDAPYFANLHSLINCYGDMSEEEHQKWFRFISEDCCFRPRTVDLFLEDGMTLNFGNTQMEVIHTPGHTRGHCVFYFPEEKVLFLGDYDLTKAGPYYGDRSSSIEDTLKSLERLKKYEAEIYLTAHGKGIYNGDKTMIDRYLNIIHFREERLKELLKGGPKTFHEIVQEGIIYGKNPTNLGQWDLLMSERTMIAKHLFRLLNQGYIFQKDNIYVNARL